MQIDREQYRNRIATVVGGRGQLGSRIVSGGVMGPIGASEPPSRISYTFDAEVKAGRTNGHKPDADPLLAKYEGRLGRPLRWSSQPISTVYQVRNGWLCLDGQRIRPFSK